MLAVVGADGSALAVVERAVVRVLGITTWAVHLVGFAPDGRVWVQQRAFDKATDPGRWDTLMGGQVGAGESVAATLERETQEETGLAIAALADVRHADLITVRRPVAEGYVVEHIEVFEATVPATLVPRNQDGEVERFECLSVAALRRAARRRHVHARSGADPRPVAGQARPLSRGALRAADRGERLCGGAEPYQPSARTSAISSASGASDITAWPAPSVTVRARRRSPRSRASAGTVIWSRSPRTIVVGQCTLSAAASPPR